MSTIETISSDELPTSNTQKNAWQSALNRAQDSVAQQPKSVQLLLKPHLGKTWKSVDLSTLPAIEPDHLELINFLISLGVLGTFKTDQRDLHWRFTRPQSHLSESTYHIAFGAPASAPHVVGQLHEQPAVLSLDSKSALFERIPYPFTNLSPEAKLIATTVATEGFIAAVSKRLRVEWQALEAVTPHDAQASAENGTVSIGVELLSQHEGVVDRVQITLNTQMLRPLRQEKPAKHASAKHDQRQPFEATLVLNTVPMSVSSLKTLNLHDVVVVANPLATNARRCVTLQIRTKQGKLYSTVSIAECEFHADGKSLRVIRTLPFSKRSAVPSQPSASTSKQRQSNKRGASMQDSTTLEKSQSETSSIIDELCIDVQFEIGAASLTMGELTSLTPDMVLPLGKALDQQCIKLRANGKEIGAGELVQLGGTLGVRITHLNNAENPSESQDNSSVAH